MPEGLLKTKLFAPPPRPNQVTRTALLEKLTSARQARIPCALVSAPAGFGKTTLVGDWVRASGLPFAWLALDEGDNDPLRFWRYMDAALQTIDSHIGESLRPALFSMQAPVLQQIITGLVNDIVSTGKDFILVLEDYHVIEQTEIHESLNFLLDHLPPQMQLVLTTRSDPPLNLARRRGRGQLVEIRATDLRFTPAEISAFLNQIMLLDLAEADIAALGQRTEGWIAGLQMVALSMQDEFDRHAFVAAFSGDDHYIADYLMEEVLQRQPMEFQNFLQQTSILDRLNAPLCDALTGRQDSRAMLNTLERANLFILPLDNRREWFRYHHLFGELLQKRLRETHSADEVANLQRAASAWYEAQGDIPAAIRHARTISDDILILKILEKNAVRFFFTGNLPQLFEIANLLPPALRPNSPFVCIAAAWAGLASGHPPEIPAWLKAVETHFGLPAESALSDQPLAAPSRAALLEVLAIRLQLPAPRPPAGQRAHILAIRSQLNTLPPAQVLLFSTVRDLQTVMAFNLGLQAEAEGDLFLAAQSFTEAIVLARQTHNSNLFYLATGHLANIQLAQGKLRAARQTHEQALADTLPVGLNLGGMISPYNALLLAGLGTLHYEWNDLAAAEQHFNAGLAQARLWNQWESLVPLALGRARLKLRAGDTQAALSILDELDSPPLPGLELPLRALAARLRDADSASVWLAAKITEARLEPSPANEAWLPDIARLMASLHQPEKALVLIQKMIAFAQNGGRTHTLIRAKVALALVGSQPEALAEALQLAEPEGYISTFIDEGEPMQNLLNHLVRQPQLSAYAGKLLSAFDPASRKPQPVGRLVEPLSEREVEVLRYMAEGLSNPEIASRLYLSPNTLKAHAQNIFLKLEVHNRLQAVTRAKELGLIE